MTPERTNDDTDDEPDAEEIVEIAASAAKNVVFSRYSQSELRDFDVTVRFEDHQLEVDVYLDLPDDKEAARLADDAALAARGAVDDLLE